MAASFESDNSESELVSPMDLNSVGRHDNCARCAGCCFCKRSRTCIGREVDVDGVGSSKYAHNNET